MFHVTRVAAGFFILCLAADTLVVASSTATSNHQLSSPVTQTTPTSPPASKQDNQPQSTVTSYKTVVIHHHNTPSHGNIASRQSSNSSTPTGHQDGKQDQKKESSRSEMYFTMHNSHSKPQRQPENHTQRSTQVQESPKVQRSLNQIKVTRFEGDFRPMTSFREPDAQHRPQRLTSPSYSSLESDESYSSDETSNSYRGPSGEEDYTPRYEKLRVDKPKYDHPSPETPYRSEEPKRFYSNSPSKSHRGSQSFTRSPPIKTSYKAKSPPPGMTEELMDTLLQQEPQTFDSEKHKRTEQKKKFKSSDSPTTFNVGYSIGFGQPPSDDIVVGKPKDVRLHVNGQTSVWKQLNENIEMSQDLDKHKQPISFRVSDSAPRSNPKFNVLKNNGQSVLYLNKDSPTIDSVPTAGRTSFDHNRALTHSNLFDISNAVSQPPIALPLQSNFIPEHHHQTAAAATVRPKARELDIMSLYQSMGYSAPVPVLLPGSKGEAQMVHAIVIPIHRMPQFEFNWPQLAMYSHHAPTVLAGPTIIPFPTHDAFITQLPSQHTSSPSHSTRPPFLPTPNTHYNPQRSPKSSRKPKDVAKFSSTFSSPIVVVPTSSNLRQDLQKEQATLNAILAQELSRKNRHMPLGLRPSPSIKSS